MRTGVLLGLIVAMPAWADWSFVAKTDDFNLYGEANTRHKTGNVVRMWFMADYKATQSVRLPPPLLWTSYQSIRELKEFDCANRQHRSIKTMLFAAHLTKGDSLYGYESAGTFGPVAAAALDEAQFQFACK
jgi:hypothetical protein